MNEPEKWRALVEALHETYSWDGVAVWLRGRNVALGGRRPVDVILTDEGYDEVMALARSLSGMTAT